MRDDAPPPRFAPTILLRGGSYFDFSDPFASAFTIHDVAHALANICRFTGHCRRFYSVAEHSVHVSRIVPAADALGGLLHDAPEAFVGDVAKPLKQLLPEYREIEARVEAAVFARFGLTGALPEAVKLADRAMLATEQAQAMRNGDAWCGTGGADAAPVTLQFWPPDLAREVFLRRFEELTG